jgi:hypothetical protein
MDHHRNDTPGSHAQFDQYPIRFTADSSDPYELSGYYNVTDVGTSAGNVVLYAELVDVTEFDYLFSNNQWSDSTHNEQLTLGVNGGDSFNVLLGSLTGNLIAGHQYQFYTSSYIEAGSDTEKGASALGNITLKIGSATAAVPEPFSLLVWGGIACAAIIAAHRSKFLTKLVKLRYSLLILRAWVRP